MQKISILRKTLQAAAAARGDLSQGVGALGATQPEWTPEAGPSHVHHAPPSAHVVRPGQQHFFQGWTAPGQASAAGVVALGSLQAKQELQQQQQQQQGAQHEQPSQRKPQKPFLPNLQQEHKLMNGGSPASWGASLRSPPVLPAHLLGPAGPPLPIPPLAKDSGPSRLLLASLLPSNSLHQGSHKSDKAQHQAQHGRRLPHSAQSGKPRGSNNSIALNKDIMSSTSMDSLLSIVRAHGHQFDFFNISTAVSRIPKLIDSSAFTGGHGASGASSSATETPVWDNAPQHPSPHHTPKDGPGAASSSSSSQLPACAKELADRLCHLCLQHLHEFDGRGLANTAWAFAKLRYIPDASLPAQLCQAAKDKIHQFAPQNVSNLAWALVYMHYQDTELLQMLKHKACEQVAEMKPQELANCMWALASHEQLDAHTARVLGERAAGIAHVFKEQELSNILWSLGRAQQYDLHLLEPLLRAARAKIHCFMPQGVSNTVWALGQLGHRDEVLLSQVSRQCPSALNTYDSQALSNLATGLVAVGWEDKHLMQALAEEAANRGLRMPASHLAAVVSSCASFGVHNARLNGVVLELVKSRASGMEPATLASLTWAVTRDKQVQASNPQLVEALAAAALAKLDRMNGQALVTLALAFAQVGELGVPVLKQLAEHLPAVVHSLTPPQCMAVSWALGTSGAHTPESAAAIIEHAAAAELPAETQGTRAVQLCSALLAAAQVGSRVEPAGHMDLLNSTKECLHVMDAQQLGSSCWALAVLGVLDASTLNAFESTFDNVLASGMSADSAALCISIRQVCEARALLAGQLAERIGVPLTCLPPTLLPQMPPTLAAAAQSLSEPASADLDLALAGLPDLTAPALANVLGAAKDTLDRLPQTLDADLSPDVPVEQQGFWSMLMNVLPALTSPAVDAAGSAGSPQQVVISGGSGRSVSVATSSPAAEAAALVKQQQQQEEDAAAATAAAAAGQWGAWPSMWGVGGLGNGLLSGLGTGSHSASSSGVRCSAFSGFSVDNDRSNPDGLLGSSHPVHQVAAASRSDGSSMQSAARALALPGNSAGLVRGDSLEEASCLWLPKDLLSPAAEPRHQRA